MLNIAILLLELLQDHNITWQSSYLIIVRIAKYLLLISILQSFIKNLVALYTSWKNSTNFEIPNSYFRSYSNVHTLVSLSSISSASFILILLLSYFYIIDYSYNKDFIAFPFNCLCTNLWGIFQGADIFSQHLMNRIWSWRCYQKSLI